MRWSWDEFESTPKDVIDRLLEIIVEDEQKREADAQLEALKRKHGKK
jgi:hypothetical protein